MTNSLSWALNHLSPLSPWSVVNGKVIWHDDSLENPSQEEIEAKAKEYDPVSAKRSCEIKHRLNILDMDAVRPLRSQSSGSATQADVDKLVEIEEEVQQLRDELSNL